jgi:hypothetical protein
VSTYFKNRTLYPNKSQVYYSFITTQSSNAFCVYSTETYLNASASYDKFTYVDNFQLLLIPKQTLSVLFNISVNSNTGSIILTSNTVVSSSIVSYFQQNATIKLDGQTQTNVTYSMDSNNYLTAIIYVSQWHNVSTISCVTSGYILNNNHLINYSVSFNSLNATVYPVQVLNILFSISIDATAGTLTLTSTTTVTSAIVTFFQQNSILTLENQTQNNVIFYNDSSSKLCATVTVNSTHNVSTISCKTNGTILFNNYTTNFIINFTPLNSIV